MNNIIPVRYNDKIIGEAYYNFNNPELSIIHITSIEGKEIINKLLYNNQIGISSRNIGDIDEFDFVGNITPIEYVIMDIK